MQAFNMKTEFENRFVFNTPSKMTTIPARLATLTRTSPTAADAQKRVLSLYRDWYRSVSFLMFCYSWGNKPNVQILFYF